MQGLAIDGPIAHESGRPTNDQVSEGSNVWIEKIGVADPPAGVPAVVLTSN